MSQNGYFQAIAQVNLWPLCWIDIALIDVPVGQVSVGKGEDQQTMQCEKPVTLLNGLVDRFHQAE